MNISKQYVCRLHTTRHHLDQKHTLACNFQKAFWCRNVVSKYSWDLIKWNTGEASPKDNIPMGVHHRPKRPNPVPRTNEINFCCAKTYFKRRLRPVITREARSRDDCRYDRNPNWGFNGLIFFLARGRDENSLIFLNDWTSICRNVKWLFETGTSKKCWWCQISRNFRLNLTPQVLSKGVTNLL